MITGNLAKMNSAMNQPVKYSLPVGDRLVELNSLLGKHILIEFLDQINCIKCGRITKTSFSQGFCYPCFVSVPETEDCVLRPELCQAHIGIARDMEYARVNCLNDQVVYLAVSGGLKVGVTRKSQVPTRWIDQGAWKTIKLAVAPNRYLAGSIEVALKEHMNDKTNWRHMLINKMDTDIDLQSEKRKAAGLLHPDFKTYITDEDDITTIEYPVEKYPDKVKSLNLEKTPKIEGTLTGIRGQYLIFEDGSVLNIRKYGGYLVNFDIRS